MQHTGQKTQGESRGHNFAFCVTSMKDSKMTHAITALAATTVSIYWYIQESNGRCIWLRNLWQPPWGRRDDLLTDISSWPKHPLLVPRRTPTDKTWMKSEAAKRYRIAQFPEVRDQRLYQIYDWQIIYWCPNDTLTFCSPPLLSRKLIGKRQVKRSHFPLLHMKS